MGAWERESRAVSLSLAEFAGNEKCGHSRRSYAEIPTTSHLPKLTVANYREFKDHAEIAAAVLRILSRQRFVSPIDVFVEMGLLMTDDLARWKQGQVPSLERVIRCNLTRAGRILRLLRFHVHDLNLKPSITVYQRRGQRLRFSLSGEPKIEEAWSRHFVVVGKRNPFAAPETDGL